MTELSTQETHFVAVGAFMDELVRAGVKHFCVAPGSRSTPLSIMIARQKGAKLWMHLDERSASYFALGLAKARQEPVVLVCTSGTAAANFFPAVVEAFYARVPLIVLTADRPHELRDVGAAQTINQVGLYGSHVRWSFDLAEPSAGDGIIQHVRTIAARAASTARDLTGPVHVNWPLREPLVPVPVELEPAWRGRTDSAWLFVEPAKRVLAPEAISRLAAELVGKRGLIACGPEENADLAVAAATLARALGYPILADPLSGVRCGPHDRSLVIDAYDAFLRDPQVVEQLVPEVIIRFGAIATSKPLLQYIERHSAARQIVVDRTGGWNEPSALATDLLHADELRFCEDLATAVVLEGRTSADPGWSASWLAANTAARTTIEAKLAESDEPFEGRVFAELARTLPDNATLFVGNSMPVRDLDTFFPSSEKKIRFMSNRGTNGIDGVVSSAFGATIDAPGPVVLAIGDISFYHDSNGLLAAKRHGLDLTVVLINNDGGGIFSFLSQSTEATDEFEQLFGTPHGLEFDGIVETYGGTLERPSDWRAFEDATALALNGGGLRVIEVRTNRQHNVEQHRVIWPAVREAVRQALAEVGATAVR